MVYHFQLFILLKVKLYCIIQNNNATNFNSKTLFHRRKWNDDQGSYQQRGLYNGK